jgi:protein-disulfide isomerase
MRTLLASGVALCALVGQVQQFDDMLAKRVASLEASQTKLERDVTAMNELLSAVLDANNGGDSIPHLAGSAVPLPDAPTAGSDSAPVTVVELADYHCPYCRRFALDVLPRLRKEYISTGRVRYMFVDFPLTELHPNSLRAHQAADCARRSGKYWEMHDELFARPASSEVAIIAAAAAVGLDAAEFHKCIASEQYESDTLANVTKVHSLGITATPTTLIGITPKHGEPFVVQRYITGVQPFVAFKIAVGMTLLGTDRHDSQ